MWLTKRDAKNFTHPLFRIILSELALIPLVLAHAKVFRETNLKRFRYCSLLNSLTYQAAPNWTIVQFETVKWNGFRRLKIAHRLHLFFLQNYSLQKNKTKTTFNYIFNRG